MFKWLSASDYVSVGIFIKQPHAWTSLCISSNILNKIKSNIDSTYSPSHSNKSLYLLIELYHQK